MAFTAANLKSSKRDLGRTGVTTTPIAIRSKLSLTDRFESAVRDRLADHIGHLATVIERGTVRFEDINGPRGGVDTVCRIKIVVSGRPSVQVEKRAASVNEAFSAALHALDTVLERTMRKHGYATGRGRGGGKAAGPGARGNGGSLVGRRVGRGGEALDRALARPEKQRRDAYVDTARPGTSATDRKAGGNATARRNTLARTDRATATLEDSRTKPSRKSTRRSANRGKPSQGKERTAVAKSVTPKAKATRALARR